MPAPKLSADQLAEIYRRASGGEKIQALAREHGVPSGPLTSRLFRVYKFRSPMERTQTVVMPGSVRELAYFAALIDGEGSITRDRDQPKVSIKMTHEGVIQWLASFGGRRSKPYMPRGNRRRVYGWSVQRKRDVVAVLTAVRPFLKIKGEEADTAIARLTQGLAGFED